MKNLTKKIVGGLALVATLGGCVTTSPSKGVAPTRVDDLTKLEYIISTPSGKVRKSFKEVNPKFKVGWTGSEISAGSGINTSYFGGQFYHNVYNVTNSDVNNDGYLGDEELTRHIIAMQAINVLPSGVDRQKLENVRIDLCYNKNNVCTPIVSGIRISDKSQARSFGDYFSERIDPNSSEGRVFEDVRKAISESGGGDGGGSSGGGGGDTGGGGGTGGQ